MKKIALSLLLLVSANAFAASAKLQGFIGLNLFDYTKVSDQDATSGTGFDMFRATITGKRDAFAAKMVLNLDLTRDEVSADSFHLFDEVNVTYNYEDMIYLTFGKAILPFQNFHYGAIKPYLVDGGSFYDHSTFRPTHFRNEEGVLLTSVKYENENLGLVNEFSVYGRAFSQEGNSYEEQKSEKTFEFREQRGFADKITYKLNDEHKFVVSGKWFKHDLAPEATYAGHLYYEFTGESWNIWAGYLYGEYFAHDETEEELEATYHVAQSKEHIAQIGAEYDFSELMNFYTNIEYYHTVDREYEITSKGYWMPDLDSEKTVDSIRVELGTKFKMAKDAFINVGVIHERNTIEFSAAMDGNKTRYQGYGAGDELTSNVTTGVASLSYWF